MEWQFYAFHIGRLRNRTAECLKSVETRPWLWSQVHLGILKCMLHFCNVTFNLTIILWRWITEEMVSSTENEQNIHIFCLWLTDALSQTRSILKRTYTSKIPLGIKETASLSSKWFESQHLLDVLERDFLRLLAVTAAMHICSAASSGLCHISAPAQTSLPNDIVTTLKRHQQRAQLVKGCIMSP